MTIIQFHTAYRRLLRMIRNHFPVVEGTNPTKSILELFQIHFDNIARHPQFHRQPGALIRHDIRIRGHWTGHAGFPPIWREDEVDRALLDATLGTMQGRYDNLGYRIVQPKQLAATQNPNKRSFQNGGGNPSNTTNRQQQQRGQYSKLCIGCGLEHAGFCKEERTLLVQGDTPGSWFPRPGGERICFSYNRSACNASDPNCSKGAHNCSVCGSRHHAMPGHHNARHGTR